MNSNITHIVVDMLYDFINGSLACSNTTQAIEETIKYINNNPAEKVLYVCDYHPADHCSFIENGGIWPTHCVEGSKGSQIHEDFYKKIIEPNNRPNINNIFYKAHHKDLEEYSCYNAKDKFGNTLHDKCFKSIIISGIATEYCIKESVLAMHKNNFNVTILKKGLAYVNIDGHNETIALLKEVAKFK